MTSLDKVERNLINMEEGETVSTISRKELRKQKLMEYLAAKGKLKLPNPKPYLQDDYQYKNPVTSALKVVKGKENKAPADRSRYEGTKVFTFSAESTTHPARKAFGVTNKANVKSRTLIGEQNTNCPSASSGPARPKPNQNLVLTNTHTVVSFKSNLSAVSHLKKQANTGIQSSEANRTAAVTSNSRFNRSSNAVSSGPMKTVSVRMSLGPFVKTKTGLIPAVTQPRNTEPHLTQTCTTATEATTLRTTSVANKVRPSTLPSACVSQRSAMAQRRTLPATALNNPGSSTSRAGINVQGQKKSNSKSQLGKHSQPPCKNQLSSGLKSTSIHSKCTVAPIKPERMVGMSKTNRSAGQPADRSTKQRYENGQPCKIIPQTSLRPASSYSSRAVSEVTRAAVSEQDRKTRTCKETQSKKGQSASHVAPQKKETQRASALVTSQTVPQPTRTTSCKGQATGMNMPKVPVTVIPQTEGKKLTAAQEERMRKLQEWREAKGISYKRPPMPVKPQVRRTVAVPQPFWTAMTEEDEAHSLISAMDRSLDDCIKLLGEGCLPDLVKEIVSRLPAVSKKFAKYWICQARLMEQEGNLDILPMFEEAVRVVLEPVDDLRTVVFEILKKKDEIQASAENEKEEDQISTVESTPESCNNPVITPKPVRALICGEKGDSSVVKYKITATPGGLSSQRREPARVNGQEVRFFTPVRRSVRIERASLRYPESLQDHDLCVASYNDLLSEEDKDKSEEQKVGDTSPSVNNTPMYIYRHNEALDDKVSVQLV
ncbi:cytoskeleton-associated protein 2-like [Mastacembelus armatus]|uniref:Cytoskeleton associated protein 2-like n=1 Tax=Mastacembelus armatus TaxID=205130 RepID=A0A3Q3L7B0_9TELE|nr:cytoskeleton-associated protein 2-like [Mastacembelus armatus]